MSELNEKFLSLLNTTNVSFCAQHVVDLFVTNEDQNAVDYDFKLHRGKMESQKNNTVFQFDTKENTILREIYDILDNKDFEINKEQVDCLNNFCNEIVKNIELNLKDKIREKIRSIFKVPKEIMLMEDFQVLSFNIEICPDKDYVVVVEKQSPKNITTSSVSEELIAIQDETGKDFDQIIKEKKEAGDNNYKYVIKATKKKYFYQCRLDLFVDYSLRLPGAKKE